jgi:hypothetical protein
VQQAGRFALRFLVPPIIPTCRGRAGVPGQLLHGDNICAAIQHVADKRPPEVVRAEIFHPGLNRTLSQDDVYGLGRHALAGDPVPLVDRTEQRPSLKATGHNPGVKRRFRATGGVHRPGFVAAEIVKFELLNIWMNTAIAFSLQ